MDTAVIRYRVAEFLKKQPPFQALDERDLLALAARGRVRFHEANDYILWQGEPHKLDVFVIQQGTVSLWDEADGRAALRDVRGAGDMLGIERFTGAPRCLHSARSESDVVTYAFPADDFASLVLASPYAREFVEGYEGLAADYQRAKDRHDLHALFLAEVVGQRPFERCGAETSIRDAAQSLLTGGADAIAVLDRGDRLLGVVTAASVLGWVAAGAGDAGQPIAGLLPPLPPALGPDASLVDGVLAIAEAGAEALAVTSDGSAAGQLHAVVTARSLARVFGDQPVSILREISLAAGTRDLRDLNHRARALALQCLTSAPAFDWVARFVSLADIAIVKRVIALADADVPPACWCVCGASGRGESVTRHAPQLVLVCEDDTACAEACGGYERAAQALAECDYATRGELSFGGSFPVASRADWQTRYENWMRDPVRAQLYLARPLFDLRPVHGSRRLWHDLETAVVGAVDRDFLRVLANDCLASLPPLTFFEDAVVEESGDQTAIFRLEHSALQPLVDVGRVFGMAAGRGLGASTLERFASARALLPEHESIFRDASETLRILLWQQARIGIGQGTSGAELPPALLSRHDRHILKSGFRSILRLLEFTGDAPWFESV